MIMWPGSLLLKRALAIQNATGTDSRRDGSSSKSRHSRTKHNVLPFEMFRHRESSGESSPKAKKQRILPTEDSDLETRPSLLGTSKAKDADAAVGLHSLERPISPPPARRSSKSSVAVPSVAIFPIQPVTVQKQALNGESQQKFNLVPSAFQLTRIRDLPNSSNVDTVGLSDILGNPMIKECWQFNYLHDVDFIMSHLDEDVRGLVQVKVVHGSWKKDSPHRIRLEEAAKRYPNVQLITAYMPEPFGTHHSKMMVLVRHDNCAQVIIHTANMIPMDWTNMTQAVWRSPILPLISEAGLETPNHTLTSGDAKFGSGAKFKTDLLAYLRAYGSGKTGSLVKTLENHDFGEVRAALVASTPSKLKVGETKISDAMWGWPGLKRVLNHVSCQTTPSGNRPHVVSQVSSIATLGQTDKWLTDTFFDTLSATASPNPLITPIQSLSSSRKPKFSVIFPTADEIRRSLNGYDSGGSIHMRIQSAAQAKQVAYMKPYLCHWSSDAGAQSQNNSEEEVREIRQAGRRRAAPHIKTYIRFSDSSMSKIDWAMVSSANLSTQAWGAAPNAAGEVRICSWEIGVLVWPDLWSDLEVPYDGSSKVEMVPVFGKDAPTEGNLKADGKRAVVGFRMPYDLPLVPYSASDMPWCATIDHMEPDWMGRTYSA